MPILMTLGAALFFAGGFLFLGVLFASGGVARSRQFEVLGQLWSGKQGAVRRALLLLSLTLIAMGALALFSAVVAKDAERAARCVDYCHAHEFSTGTIGPSIDRTPANRFVACTCTGPDRDALELRADSLAR